MGNEPRKLDRQRVEVWTLGRQRVEACKAKGRCSEGEGSEIGMRRVEARGRQKARDRQMRRVGRIIDNGWGYWRRLGYRRRWVGLSATKMGLSATVHHKYRWVVFFLFWYFFFFLTENSRRMAPNGEWASLGVFIVVFSDKMFLSLLPTSSDKFWFCHKRS